MPRYEDFLKAIDQTGIWRGQQRDSHGFVVSPDFYQLQPDDRRRLDQLGRAMDACLLGVSRIMAIAADPGLVGGKTSYRGVHLLMSRGSLYGLTAADTRPASLPLTRKVDIVPDARGHLWIAEIDATNPRSLGYSLLGRELVRTAEPKAAMLPGVAPFIAEALGRRGVTEITFLYGHTQRFYAPEFLILATELRRLGITMVVVDETEVEIVSDRPRDIRSRKPLPLWFMDLPSMAQNRPLISWMVDATRKRRVEYLVPPKYFLGSKAMLAMLSNADEDRGLEGLLLTQIEPKALAIVREHIPPTVIVSRTTRAEPGWILKRLVASGAKGVWFYDDPGYAKALEMARREPGTFVLQREVAPGPYGWRWFKGSRLMPPADWFLRLTAYFSYRGVEDIAITGCRTKLVHGGKDAILTGTALG